MEDHSMNGNTYDVVIIGGGVIGSSIAAANRHAKRIFIFFM